MYVASIGVPVVLTNVCATSVAAMVPTTRASMSIATSGNSPRGVRSAPKPGSALRPNDATSSSDIITITIAVIRSSPPEHSW